MPKPNISKHSQVVSKVNDQAITDQITALIKIVGLLATIIMPLINDLTVLFKKAAVLLGKNEKKYFAILSKRFSAKMHYCNGNKY